MITFVSFVMIAILIICVCKMAGAALRARASWKIGVLEALIVLIFIAFIYLAIRITLLIHYQSLGG